jgi:hypothetical protein
MTEPAARTRSTFLGPHDMYRLDHACVAVVEAFGCCPYLVGSVFTRQDFRDVDVRLVLNDDVVEAMFPEAMPHLRRFVNCALSDWLGRASGLPVDFQIQAVSEANQEKGVRSALGINALRRAQEAYR